MRIDSPAAGKLTRSLSLFDAVALVVSGIVGFSIFIVPADVLRGVGTPLTALLLWVVAGAITLIVGLVCAELGGMFPEAGGQYVYIREAFGGFSAFLFGWVFFSVANSAALAAMVIVFALFLGRAIPSLSAEHVLYARTIFGIHFEFARGSLVAILVVLLVTAVNVRSVKLAARLQSLTAAFYLGVVGIIAALGFALGRGSWSHFVSQPGVHASSASFHGIGVALIALIFTYDGWEYVTWAAGEIENARRNLPLALIIGILLVVGTYVLVNVLFMYALTPERMVLQTTVAEGAITAMFSATQGKWVSLFIAMLCFGAASVVTLAGARIYYCMSRDGVFFPLHGPPASPLEYSHGQPVGAVCVGGDVDRQRQLRRALCSFRIHHHAHLRGHGGRRVRLAPHSAGSAAALSMSVVSLVAGRLPAGCSRTRYFHFIVAARAIADRVGPGTAGHSPLLRLWTQITA